MSTFAVFVAILYVLFSFKDQVLCHVSRFFLRNQLVMLVLRYKLNDNFWESPHGSSSHSRVRYKGSLARFTEIFVE